MYQISLNKAFLEIRNYLAGKAIGITRDKSLLHEVTKCLFCKIHILKINKIDLEQEELARKYREAFNTIKKEVPDIFKLDEEILLDPHSIYYIDNILNSVNLIDPHNDPLSEMYQTFIGSEVRGNEGQFFTPTEAVKLLVEMIDPKQGERLIDPACGAGSFLSYSARFLNRKRISMEIIQQSLYGIEKDSYLANLTKTHLALSILHSSHIYNGDSIEQKDQEGNLLPIDLDGQFDIVLANPPFGAKIKIGTDETKKKFHLAHKWIKNKQTARFEKTEKLVTNPSPQILFLELCLKLLCPGGRMGIVIPESLLSNAATSYVVQYLLDNAEINCVLGMPENLFKTSGKGGTHTKTCLVIATKKKVPGISSKNKIFMAEAKWCGHDSRGNLIPNNDLPTILDNFRSTQTNNDDTTLGYWIDAKNIYDFILAPRYYNPATTHLLHTLSETHELISIGDLVQKGILEIKTGDEIGKLAYGTGSIPFIRTSDISNWEIKLDPKQGVSEEIYQSLAKKQNVQEGDILMVKDGTYLIGTCAYISKYDTKILYQSHLYKIRILDKNTITPYLLLAALSSQPVLAQIQEKRFTQDIIDSLGKRISELILPLPKKQEIRHKIEEMVKRSIHERMEARELARFAKEAIISH